MINKFMKLLIEADIDGRDIGRNWDILGCIGSPKNPDYECKVIYYNGIFCIKWIAEVDNIYFVAEFDIFKKEIIQQVRIGEDSGILTKLELTRENVYKTVVFIKLLPAMVRRHTKDSQGNIRG